MATLYLIEGPVGAGKSTYAAALARRDGGVHIALDAWFARLFSPDRPEANIFPWYAERKNRLLELIWAHSRHLLAAETDVILELGLIQRQLREPFCRRVRNEGFALQVFVLDAPREVRRERVRQRNLERGPTFSMVVPDAIFEMASDVWEAPDDGECAAYAVTFVNEA